MLKVYFLEVLKKYTSQKHERSTKKYTFERLKSSLRKFYGRYGDLIKHYEISLSQMLHDILGHDHIQ